MPRARYGSRCFPKKKKPVSFSSHGGDFGDCDGTKPRFRRVTLQRPLRETPPTNLVVFSRHSAPLIFKQYLRVLLCDSAVSGAAPPSILEFSTFPSSASPAPFRRILRLRIFAAIRNIFQQYIDVKIIRGIAARHIYRAKRIRLRLYMS